MTRQTSSEHGGDSISATVASAAVRRVSQGPVLPIGGAEDTSRDSEILSRFVALAGGKRARIAIVPTASEDPRSAGEGYAELVRKMDAKQVEWIAIEQRADANTDPVLAVLRNATGIFITGGDQARLVSLLMGTRAIECIRQRNAGGVVVAGTSAGASAVAGRMLLGGNGNGGDSDDAAARQGIVETVAGFGLLQDVIVDQHFSERGRMGRLLSVFAANPGLIGIGLDEDTAVLIDRSAVLETLGTGMVTLIDGRNSTSDYFERRPGEVLTVVKSGLHVLGPGRRFDLDARSPLSDLPN